MESCEEAVSVTSIRKIVNENGEVIRDGSRILCQCFNNGFESIDYIEEDTLNTIESQTSEDTDLNNSSKFEWGDNDTKLLLDLYGSGLANVGPLRKSRKKKELWGHISSEIELKLNLKRTPAQCESRYKTIMRRRAEQVKGNKTSGEVRTDVPYENEIAKIKSIDDSLQPEVLMSCNNLQINPKGAVKGDKINPIPSASKNNDKCNKRKKSQKEDLIEFLQKIHDAKEENKNKRHKEKLDLIKSLLKKDEK